MIKYHKMTIALIVLGFFILVNVVVSIILFIRQEIQGKWLREETTNKLEKIRETVDEKLHNTLERRLGDSFKLVSERLEHVHRGLGEIQGLANQIGDLKKVFTNVSTRGAWGEIQLGALLEEILTPEQYARNVIVKQGSKEMVDFAIKLPGKGDGAVWLPIDAKFPKEDYERLLEASSKSDMERFRKRLEETIKGMAKDIKNKYVFPPNTTDFAILFLATEGLYAEMVRRPGLFEHIQREYRIIIAGPTILAALLNSLQMGFRTLTIEERASCVWHLLTCIKTEFSKFSDILDKTYKQIQIVSKTIEDATRESRNIEKRLKDVELPHPSSLINDNISSN